jgi:hypothetical protein
MDLNQIGSRPQAISEPLPYESTKKEYNQRFVDAKLVRLKRAPLLFYSYVYKIVMTV